MLDAVSSSSAPPGADPSAPADPHAEATQLIGENTRHGAVDAQGLAQAVAGSSGDRTALAAGVAQALPPSDKGAFVEQLTVIAHRPAPPQSPPQHQSLQHQSFWGGLWDQAKDAGGVLAGAAKDLGGLALGAGRTAADLTLGPAVDAARDAAGLVTGHTPDAPSWLPSEARGVQTLEHAGKTLYTAATHPGAVWDGLKAPYEQDIAQGRWGALIAQTAVDFGGLLDGESEAVDVARAASVAEKVGETAGDVGRGAHIAEDGASASEKTVDAARAAATEAHALQAPTAADLAAYRAKLGVPETQTVAVAKTNIPGLEAATFEGASPKVLREAGLPPAEPGPIASPIPNPLFTRHAEEVLSNQVVRAVESHGLTPAELDGHTLEILVSQPVCNACKAGLADPSASAGVLKQLSERYPGLTINVRTEGASQSLTLLGGKIIAR